MVSRVRVDTAEKFRRSLQFVSANADADDMAVTVACRQFENFLRFLDSKVAGGGEDPQQRHAEISRAPSAPAIEAFEDGGEILLAVQADAHRNVDLRVQHIFFLQSLHQAVRNRSEEHTSELQSP